MLCNFFAFWLLLTNPNSYFWYEVTIHKISSFSLRKYLAEEIQYFITALSNNTTQYKYITSVIQTLPWDHFPYPMTGKMHMTISVTTVVIIRLIIEVTLNFIANVSDQEFKSETRQWQLRSSGYFVRPRFLVSWCIVTQ